ncbi:pyridoxal-dependent decarboxylase [Lonsdalea quercina]|uniref:pyridoxal-dependent decarboxylase n=1 Tax=Lonsdalea quercina TaxID=71657 RepID=UPI003974C3FD
MNNDPVKHYTGIQVNLRTLTISDKTIESLHRLTNNLGDCYEEEVCPLPNTMNEERAAVELVSGWLNLDKEETWGYVGEGSSIGNLQGMWMGMTLIKDATLIFTDQAHYSIPKFGSILKFKNVKVIKTTQEGSIDINDLAARITENEKLVVVLTAGTTITSAYDDINRVLATLKDKHCPFYLHLDAALGGFILPFINDEDFPDRLDYTFANPSILSLTVSCHKVIGVPMPSNIFISRWKVYEAFKKQVNKIEYFENKDDVTVYGSRDGFRAGVVYERLSNIKKSEIAEWVSQGISLASYLADKISTTLGIRNTFSVKGGLATVFSKTEFDHQFSQDALKRIVQRYRLVNDGRFYHMYQMAHMDKPICDEFIDFCLSQRECIDISYQHDALQ